MVSELSHWRLSEWRHLTPLRTLALAPVLTQPSPATFPRIARRKRTGRNEWGAHCPPPTGGKADDDWPPSLSPFHSCSSFPTPTVGLIPFGSNDFFVLVIILFLSYHFSFLLQLYATSVTVSLILSHCDSTF